MTDKNKNKLFKFFATLECDIEFGLAEGLAEKLGTTSTEIFQLYEEWQVLDYE
jgi:hypothetical protein